MTDQPNEIMNQTDELKTFPLGSPDSVQDLENYITELKQQVLEMEASRDRYRAAVWELERRLGRINVLSDLSREVKP